jgi:hypothetical protein
MKRFLAFFASMSALASLAACAAPNHRHVDEPRGIDAGKVIAVDRWARREHATVLWIHHPQTKPGD